MRKLLAAFATIAVAGAVVGMLLSIPAAAQVQQVMVSSGQQTSGVQPLAVNLNGRAHVFPLSPTVKALAAQHNGGTPPLLYHGGPVMLKATTYAIFWVPPTLQDGTPTSMSAHYRTVQTNLFKEYPGHSIGNNNTQYYQVVNNKATYIKNQGNFAATYVDTSPYPGSDCYDPSTQLTNGFNCISDGDLQNEIAKVMALKGWTGGTNKMFFVFTSSNEGQCYYSNSSCSYYNYCAYHSYFVNGSGQYVIYGNEPYGNTNVCQIPGAPSPNSDAAADAAATAASHELTEAITDPLLNAWYDSSGYEIGDECAYYYGNIGWNSGTATEKWDGFPFFLQTEYSNNIANWYISDPNFTGCFNAGPEL